MAKLVEKNKAIELRRQGLSYSQILKKVPVYKSTLSLWFREVKLSTPQLQRLTQRKIDAAWRGAQKRRQQRLEVSEKIRLEAQSEIAELTGSSLKIFGAALYWAEGSKQKEHAVSVGVVFTNSDPEMARFFYNWLIKVCHISPKNIYFEFLIHENADIERSKKFWAHLLGVSKRELSRITLKKDKGNIYRRNRGSDYHGVLRIRVRKSTNLNRRIMSWAGVVACQFKNYSEFV